MSAREMLDEYRWILGFVAMLCIMAATLVAGVLTNTIKQYDELEAQIEPYLLSVSGMGMEIVRLREDNLYYRQVILTYASKDADGLWQPNSRMDSVFVRGLQLDDE